MTSDLRAPWILEVVMDMGAVTVVMFQPDCRSRHRHELSKTRLPHPRQIERMLPLRKDRRGCSTMLRYLPDSQKSLVTNYSAGTVACLGAPANSCTCI